MDKRSLSQGIHDILLVTSNVVETIFTYIQKIKPLYLIFFEAIFFIIGLLCNNIHSFYHFYLYQFVFLFIFTVSFFSIRWYETTTSSMKELQRGDTVLFNEYEKIYRLRRSKINLYAPILLGTYFGIQALILINFNIASASAIYLIFLYIMCVFVSFLGYLQFIYWGIYIHRLNKIGHKITLYERHYPSNTKWINIMTKISVTYRNIFFLLGSVYIFAVIFFVFSPKFNVIDKIIDNHMFIIPFILFIGGVFLAIVVLFPLFCGMEYYNTRNLIDALKYQTVERIKYKNKHIKPTSDEYFQKGILIVDIFNTPSYPFRDFWGRLFSTTTTMANIAAAIVTIIQFSLTFGKGIIQ